MSLLLPLLSLPIKVQRWRAPTSYTPDLATGGVVRLWRSGAAGAGGAAAGMGNVCAQLEALLARLGLPADTPVCVSREVLPGQNGRVWLGYVPGPAAGAWARCPSSSIRTAVGVRLG